MDTPARVRSRIRDPNDLASPRKTQAPVQAIDQNTLRNDFMTIMQGIQQMPKPDRTGPVVCFSELSLPILIAPLSLEEGDATGVTLPVIGISHYKNGRATVFGNTQILTECNRENTDGSAFLENIIKWASGVQRGRIACCIVGYSAADTEILQRNLSGFGFRVIASATLDLSHHVQVILIPSDYDDPEKKLIEFVANGGGVICTLQPPSIINDQGRYRMNSTMSEFGLGFPSTGLLVGPVNAPYTKVNPHFSVLSKYTFSQLSKTLMDVLNKSEIDISELDSCVTAVRYNVSCMPQSSDPNLLAIENAAYGYLKSHNYETEEGYCSTVFHGVVSVLLCEAQAKMSASCFVGQDFSERFPGKASEEPDGNDVVSVQLTIQREGWVSTGYWLPAGVMATISTESEFPPGLVIQVGMHAEAIFQKEGPWQRWPIITTSFDFKPTTEIANPFGGMIYIILDHQLPEKITLDLSIDHVFPYPRFSLSDPSIWDKTRDRGAPWAEVETKYVTFVAPARIVRAAKSLKDNAKMIDDLIESVLEFLDDKEEHSFRCVFDVELIEGPVCGYPIIMGVDQCDSFFDEIVPSESLFVLTTFIGMLSLPEGAFDPGKESSLACAATCSAFLKKWPDVSPLDFSRDMLPPHFNELWNIYKKDNGKALTEAMGKIRTIRCTDSSDDDLWTVFINEIQVKTGLDLNHLLDMDQQKVDPAQGNMIATMSSASLQSFQLLDEI